MKPSTAALPSTRYGRTIVTLMHAAWMFILPNLSKYLKEDPNVELINVHGIGFKLVVKV
jgi:hypothetical protein